MKQNFHIKVRYCNPTGRKEPEEQAVESEMDSVSQSGDP